MSQERRQGKHRSPEGNHGPDAFAYLLIGGASMLLGLIPLIAGVAEAMRYQPEDDPGAESIGAWLAVVGILMILVPVGIVLVRVTVAGAREYSAWKKSLTPAQRLAVNIGEALGMELLHLRMKHQHEERQALLAASTSGEMSYEERVQRFR